MYRRAPINGLINKHDIHFDDETGETTLYFTPEINHCHTAGSLHGSGYFKLMDDAAFFAAQAKVEDNFIFTVSFNTYLLKAIVPGVKLVAKGRTTSVSKSLVVAEAEIYTVVDNNLVAQGSGSFMKSPVSLDELRKKDDKEGGKKNMHHAPAGEIGGYYPGKSTLPPSYAPMSAYLRVEESPAEEEEK